MLCELLWPTRRHQEGVFDLEETRKAVSEGRMVVISWREEARMRREDKLREFEQRLRREGRQLLIAVDPSDYE